MNQQTVGDRLKAARNQRHLTYQEVQQISKVQQKYLEAIEADMFSLLPSEFYAKAFIRQFAQAVGEDGEKLVDLYLGKPIEEEPDEDEVYLSEFIQPEEEPVKEYFKEVDGSRAKKKGRGFRSQVPMIILAFVALLILAGVVYITVATQNARSPIYGGGDNITTNNQLTTDETSAPETTEETTTVEETTTQPEPEPDFTLMQNEGVAVAGSMPPTTRIEVKAEHIRFPIEVTFTAGAGMAGRIAFSGITNAGPLANRSATLRGEQKFELTREMFADQTGENKHFTLALEGYIGNPPWTYQPMNDNVMKLTINGKQINLTGANNQYILGIAEVAVDFTSFESTSETTTTTTNNN